MGATASRTDDFTDPDSDPHPFDLSSTQNVRLPIIPIDPGNDDDDFSIAELNWNSGGHSVYVTGAWDGWNNKYALYRTHQNDFTAVLLLPVGTFQYKFIIDGNWKYVFCSPFSYSTVLLPSDRLYLFLFIHVLHRPISNDIPYFVLFLSRLCRHSSSLPSEQDSHGNLNNVITVVARPKEFDSNDLPHEETIAPDDNYDFSILPQEDHATEPPNLPRMLSSAPLDRYARPNAPTPDFVRLNHVFETDTSAVYGPNQMRTVATELRYKSKIITTVLLTTKSKIIPSIPSHPQTQQQYQAHSQHQNHLQQRYQPQPHHSQLGQQQQYHATSSPANVTQNDSQTLLMDALNNV